MKKKSAMKITAFILSVCTVFSLSAQVGSVDIIDRFEECSGLYASVRIGNRIFTGSNSLDNLYYRPTVVCTDTNGTVIWNSAQLGLLPYSYESLKSLHASADGFLYGICTASTSANAIFKMNPANGALVWSVTLSADVIKLRDYGSNIACLYGSNGMRLKILNASNGAEISNHFLTNNYYLEDFAVDGNQNVYYPVQDTLVKLNHLNLNQVSWKVKYNSQNMYRINHVFYDDISGKLVVFGKRSSGIFKLLIIDSLAGNVLASHETMLFDIKVHAVKIKNDNLYFVPEHAVINSGNSKFRLFKMNMTSGTLTWSFEQELAGNSDENAIVDFELDAQDNAYCYGYFNSSGWGNGSNLAMMKVNANGTLNYVKTYSYNTTQDQYSSPIGCYLLNNQLYLTGYMQDKKLGDKGNNAKLIKVNPLTGDTLFTASLGGTTVNNSSEVKFIVSHPDGGFVAFSRKGQLLNVQRFDSNNTRIWDVNYSYNGASYYAYNPIAAAIAPTGQILIGLNTTGVDTYNNLEISQTANDVMFMLLDQNGNKITEQSFYASSTMSANTKVVDVFCDGTSFFVLVNDYWGVKQQVKVSTTGLMSYPAGNYVQYSYVARQKKYYGNYSASSFMIMGNNGTANAASIKVYAKSDMLIQDVKPFPPYALEAQVFKEVGSSFVLVGGIGNQNYEFLFLMNKLTGNIVWEHPTLTNASLSEVIDMEIDASGTYAYVLSKNLYSPVIRKYNLQTGALVQTYVKPNNGYNYYANDLSLNEYTGQLVAGGIRSQFSGLLNEGYYYIVNTNLNEISESVFGSSPTGQPAVNTIHFNPSGELIVGGVKPYTSFDKGVIQFETCVESGSQNVTSCGNYLCPLNNTTYTSSGSYTIYQQTNSACDSLITLNLTIQGAVYGTDVQAACGSYVWPLNGQIYTLSGQYADTIPSAAGCDSIVTLDLTIIPAVPLTIENTFVMPSDANACVGEAAITISGNADFELDFDTGSQVITTNGYSLVTGLCAGVHDLHVTDNCGDTLSVPVVIPVDSNYIFINPFIDSLAQDSLGVTLINCDIFYNSIDTAYIDSIWATGNTVHVIWNIVDSNGSNLDTTSYVLNNGNGVYWLQLSVFCPSKSVGDYFTCTVAIYFNNGDIEAAGLPENEAALFQLYPNPASESVILTWDGSYRAMVEILDVTGALVNRCEVVSGEPIVVNDLSNALYYVRWTGNGKSSISKFVKK